MNKIFSIYFYIIVIFTVFLIKCDMNDLYMGVRPSSEPYLSGDTFRKYCDHVFDIKEQGFMPCKVKRGDLVFVGPRDFTQGTPREFIDDFFKNYHPFIKNKYILITHNSDLNITREFNDYLTSEMLFVWFAQNVAYNHPKLIPLPIGLENELWGRNYVKTIKDISSEKCIIKKYLSYMNFDPGTNPIIRSPIYNLFKNKSFCYSPQRLSIEKYLHDVSQAKFVISPHGNGLDCHRTWEALYLGVIPVVKKSSLDKLYENLPVLIVDDWSKINQEFLEKKYAEMSVEKYTMEKLFIDYWLDIFKKYKILCQM